MGYDAILGGVYIKLDFLSGKDGSSSATGLQTWQDITPSEEQFRNAEPGFSNSSSPYSTHTYSVNDGSIGKLSEEQAPTDLARPYECDLDNTRPGVLAPRVIWGGNTGAALFATNGGGSAVTSINRLVETTTFGSGIIAQNADASFNLYKWDKATGKYVWVRQVNTPVGPMVMTSGVTTRVPYANRGVVTGQGRHTWLPTTGGMCDINTAYPQANVGGGTSTLWLYSTIFGDNLICWYSDLSGAGPGITIALRDRDTLAPVTPALLSNVPAPELGNAAIQTLVTEAAMMYTPCVLPGAIYWASDRAVYKCVFDENNARLLNVPLATKFTRITSNPVAWQGSLWVASGNTVWRWTPGQSEFVPELVDQFGSLPPNLGGGTIVALYATADALYAAVVDDPVTSTTGSCLLRIDPRGTVSLVDRKGAGNAQLYPTLGLITIEDLSTNSFGPSIGILAGLATQPASARIIPIWESHRDPAKLSSPNRPQESTPRFWIGSWDSGQTYGNRKDLFRLDAVVADVGHGGAYARFYYQTDGNDSATDSLDVANGGLATGSIPGSLMEHEGAWKFAGLASTTGLTQIGAGGGYQGYLTFVLSALGIQYRRIRWAIEMVGDTSQLTYPRVFGAIATYTETPAKYVLWSIRGRVLLGDPDLDDVTDDNAPPAPATTDEVAAIVNTIWGFDKTGSPVTWVDMNGGSRLVKVTKFRYDVQDLDATPTGVPQVGLTRARKIVYSCALQETDSAV